MNRTLYPVEVQLDIFRQLLTYEHLLAPKWGMRITKDFDNYIYVRLWKAPRHHKDINSYSSGIDPRRLTTAKELDEAVARWWEAVPENCKK